MHVVSVLDRLSNESTQVVDPGTIRRVGQDIPISNVLQDVLLDRTNYYYYPNGCKIRRFWRFWPV
jgi:hypothetical protein